MFQTSLRCPLPPPTKWTTQSAAMLQLPSIPHGRHVFVARYVPFAAQPLAQLLGHSTIDERGKRWPDALEKHIIARTEALRIYLAAGQQAQPLRKCARADAAVIRREHVGHPLVDHQLLVRRVVVEQPQR